MKIDRELIRMKFNGLCAYCGDKLPERWHVDHFKPVVREVYGKNAGKMTKPENHNSENVMPSCPSCNISKMSLPLEDWRSWLEYHVESLNKHNPTYRLVKRYGLIIETKKPIVFYFEKIKE